MGGHEARQALDDRVVGGQVAVGAVGAEAGDGDVARDAQPAPLRRVLLREVRSMEQFLATTIQAAPDDPRNTLTRRDGRETARKGITANAVAPGYIATEMVMANWR